MQLKEPNETTYPSRRTDKHPLPIMDPFQLLAQVLQHEHRVLEFSMIQAHVHTTVPVHHLPDCTLGT